MVVPSSFAFANAALRRCRSGDSIAACDLRMMSSKWWNWAQGLLFVAWDVITQRWQVRGMPSARSMCDPSIAGKTCIITGPTSGIGLETARILAQAGARVILACRNEKLAKELVARWQLEVGAGKELKAEVLQLDLNSLASVQAFADIINKRKLPVNVLINNAGIFSMVGSRSETADGFESHFGVNFLSHFLLTRLLLPALVRGQPARVVMISSAMHELGAIHFDDLQLQKHYTAERAYSQSKLAQVLFSFELARRLPPLHVSSVALHPGNILTQVVRTLPRLMQRLYRLSLSYILLTPEEGARCTLHVATTPQLQASYYTSTAKPMRANPTAYDAETAARLWEIASLLVGLKSDLEILH
eukprot:jgi/Chlat1/3099/Chrsp21S03340